jgi:hypothetical protein
MQTSAQELSWTEGIAFEIGVGNTCGDSIELRRKIPARCVTEAVQFFSACIISAQ